MAADLESDLQDIGDWGWKWPVDLNAGKTQLVSFHRSNNASAIDVKMDGSVLEEESSFKMLELSFSSKLDWGSYIISFQSTRKFFHQVTHIVIFVLHKHCYL